jgi:hypothetical protein
VIPEAAVEAAAKAIYDEGAKVHSWGERHNALARAALEAAAPHMLAEAWAAGHRTCRLDPDSIGFSPYRVGSGREPQPGDGPDYHAEHAAWEARKDK